MAQADILTLEMRARDRASAQMRKVKKEMGGLRGELKKLAAGFGAFAAAQAVISMLDRAGKAAREFELGMARIDTLLGDQPELLAKLGADVSELSMSYGRAASDIQNAMFQAISAGVAAADSMEFLKVAAEAATGGFTSMETAVDGLTSIINAYGMEVEKAAEISDLIFLANKRGKTTFEEIAGRIGDVAPIAAQMGIEFEELAVFIAAVTKQGISTRKALTGLRQAFAGILKPTDDVKKAAADMGIVFDANAIATKGLVKFLKELSEATGGNAEMLGKLIPSVEALGIIAAATGATGIKELDEGMKDVANAAGLAREANDKAASTMEGRMQRAAARTAGEMKKLGDQTDEMGVRYEELKGSSIGVFNALNDQLVAFEKYGRRMGAVRQSTFLLTEAESDLVAASDELTDVWFTARDSGKDLQESADAVRDAMVRMKEDGVEASAKAFKDKLAPEVKRINELMLETAVVSGFALAPPGAKTPRQLAEETAKSMAEFRKELDKVNNTKAEEASRTRAKALREEKKATDELVASIRAQFENSENLRKLEVERAKQIKERTDLTVGQAEAMIEAMRLSPEQEAEVFALPDIELPEEGPDTASMIFKRMGDASEAETQRVGNANKAMVDSILAGGQMMSSGFSTFMQQMSSGSANAQVAFMGLTSSVLGGIAQMVPALGPWAAGLSIVFDLITGIFGASGRRGRRRSAPTPGGTAMRQTAPTAGPAGPTETFVTVNVGGRSIHTKEEIAREVGGIMRAGQRAGTSPASQSPFRR